MVVGSSPGRLVDYKLKMTNQAKKLNDYNVFKKILFCGIYT